MNFTNVHDQPAGGIDDAAAPVPPRPTSSRFGWADPRIRRAPPPAAPEPQYLVDPESGDVHELLGDHSQIVPAERLRIDSDTGARLVWNGKEWQELPTPSSGSDLVDFGKNTLTGVGKGIGGLLAAPETGLRFAREAVKRDMDALNDPNTSDATKTAIAALNLLMTGQTTLPQVPEKLPLESWLPTPDGMDRFLFNGGHGLLPYYVPHTTAGHLYQAGIEGAASGAIGGPEGAVLGALSLTGGQGLKEAGAPPGLQYAAELLLPLLAHRSPKIAVIDAPGAALDAGLTPKQFMPPASDGVSLASRENGIFAPRKVPPRPFFADYPNGAQAGANGELTLDIDGRPLTAPRIAGRNTLGGDDLPLPLDQFDPLTIEGTGNPPKLSTAAELGPRTVGATTVVAGKPTRIELLDTLSPEDHGLVHAHESGHMIDDLAGQIPIDGVEGESRFLYNDLNNPRLADARAANPDVDPNSDATFTGFGPEQMGYEPHEAPRELMAEAIRAYLTDPNYLKAIAPRVAARIRAWANPNPEVNRFVQFNSLAPLLLFGGASPLFFSTSPHREGGSNPVH